MIFFCIPVHNEEKTAGVVLWKIRQVMAEFPRDYQILLADDASTDGTGKVIDPYRRVLPLILMRSHRRRGYAAALEMLVREAARRSRYPRRDIVIVMQADFSEDADQVPALLRRMESGADLVVGGPVSSAVRPGLLERGTNRIVRNLLRRKTWPEPVSEPLVGFSAVRLACIRRALEEAAGRLLRWDGPTANAALLGAVAPHARRIDAVEITLHPERRQRPRRSSPVGTLREVWRFVHDQPASGLDAPETLVPDEVHGDLSALHKREDQPTEKRRSPSRRSPRKSATASGERPKRRRSRKSDGEQPAEPARKDRKPRRPRGGSKTAGAEGADAPADKADPAETTGAAADGGESAPKTGPKRRRGSRGGARKRKRAKPASTDGAGAETQPSGDGKPRGKAGDGSGTSPENGPPKRRRRGGRGRSRRKTGKNGSSNEAPGAAPANGGGPPQPPKDGE